MVDAKIMKESALGNKDNIGTFEEKKKVRKKEKRDIERNNQEEIKKKSE